MNYSHITPEAGMVMKKASGDDSPLWQGVGKSFRTLQNKGRRWRRLRNFSWMEARVLRVFPRGPAPPPGVAVSLPYFVSPSDSVNVLEK
jgi:hypothetical protein